MKEGHTLTGLSDFSHSLSAFTESAGMDGGVFLAVGTVILDDYQIIADGLGGLLSDSLLTQVGAIVTAAVGPKDIVARTGADEFLVILTGLKNRTAAGRLLHRVLKSIAAPRILEGSQLQITASGGIAIYPDDGADLESLYGRASTAVHESRRRGRGQWRFYTHSSGRRAQQQLRLESGLRCALQNNELSVAYQPQYDIRSGSSCGIEALARWRRADGEVVAPSVFVPLAERMNLIASLGAAVLLEACGTVAGWSTAPTDEFILAVNVSMRQMDTEFCAMVCRILDSTGFPASRLELELTESVLMNDAQRVLTRLARLRRLGIRIAMDDFGAGYSSLSYLSRLPVDRLKIDRSLVHGLSSETKNIAIVQAVIDLGRKFGFTVLAEGVETECELTTLRQLGCQQAQGFLFSKPVRAATARRLAGRNWGAPGAHGSA